MSGIIEDKLEISGLGKVNFEKRKKQLKRIGDHGEAVVIESEKMRLMQAGKSSLAENIKHKRDAARKILSENPVCLSVQVAQEFFVNAICKLTPPLSRADALAFLSAINHRKLERGCSGACCAVLFNNRKNYYG